MEAQYKMVGQPMKEGFIPSFNDLSYSLVSSTASEETETGSLAAVSSSPRFLVVGEGHCSYVDEESRRFVGLMIGVFRAERKL